MISKLKNIKLYALFFIVSLIVILISQFYTHDILDILKNICYSIIAATFMACFIDYNYLKQSIREKEEFRKRYFEEINDNLSIIIGHLLWLDENINNEIINWESNPQLFLINIHNSATSELPSQEISLNEAIARLVKLSDKYSSENLKNNNLDINKVNKIFQVILPELQWLSWKLEKINDNKIILEIKDYAHIKDIDDFLKNYYYGCEMLLNNNYQNGIKSLTQSLRLIKQLGDYDDNIMITIDELLFNMEDLLKKQIQITI